MLEVRETRLVLKNVGIDRSIKIAGGKEGSLKLPVKETSLDKETSIEDSDASEHDSSQKASTDSKGDRKRDRRRQNRRRRARDELVEGDEEKREMEPVPTETQVKVRLPLSKPSQEGAEGGAPPVLSTLLPPPPMLISETMAQYRNNALFKEAFFLKNEDKAPEGETLENGDAPPPQENIPQAESESSFREEPHPHVVPSTSKNNLKMFKTLVLP